MSPIYPTLVGPKLAITVLSGLSAEELIQAIRAGNLAKLTSIPGVGKKTAERMLVELKDKVAAILPPGQLRASRAATASLPGTPYGPPSWA